MLDMPIYRFKGRAYKTVTGLSKALFADSGCDSHSMVERCIDGTGRITCTIGRGEALHIVATYTVSPPEIGKEMIVTRIPDVTVIRECTLPMCNCHATGEPRRKPGKHHAVTCALHKS